MSNIRRFFGVFVFCFSLFLRLSCFLFFFFFFRWALMRLMQNLPSLCSILQCHVVISKLSSKQSDIWKENILDHLMKPPPPSLLVHHRWPNRQPRLWLISIPPQTSEVLRTWPPATVAKTVTRITATVRRLMTIASRMPAPISCLLLRKMTPTVTTMMTTMTLNWWGLLIFRRQPLITTLPLPAEQAIFRQHYHHHLLHYHHHHHPV